MRRTFLTFLIGWALTGVGVAQSPDAARLADGLFSRGLYDLALPEYQQLLEQDPAVGNQHVIAFRAAECARQLKRMEEAVRYYEQSLLQEGTGDTAARSRYRLAEIALAANELNEGERHLKAALKLELAPQLEAPVRFLLGQVLEGQGKPKPALEEYRTLIASFEDDPLVGLASLRMAALGEMENTERRAAYQMALQNSTTPDMKVEVLWSWAAFERGEGNLSQAAERFWELWQEFPDHPKVKQGLLQIAWANLSSSQFERVLQLKNAAAGTPSMSSPDAWAYAEAVSLHGQEREEEALKAYEALIKEHPESDFRRYAGFEAASLLAAAGRHDRVWDFEQDIREVPGREADGLWLLAESARALEQRQRAVRTYTELLKEAPDGPMAADAMYLRAVLQQDADPKKAKAELEAFVKAYPNDDRAPQALEVAGNLAMQEKDGAGAYTLWSRALDQKSPPPELVFRTGMLAVQLEKSEEALGWFTLSEDSDLPVERKAEAAYWKGILYEEGEDVAGATESYELALSRAPKAEWADRARLRLGRLYQTEGQEANALQAFLPLAREGSGENLSDSMLLWLDGVAEENDSPLARVTLAKAMQAEGRGEAVREIGFYTEAEGLQAQGQAEEAVAAWQKGLAMNSRTPEAVEAGLALGEQLLTLGRPQEALKAYARAAGEASALERGRLQAEALKGAGLSHLAQEQWEAAAKQFISVSILFDDPELVPECLELAAIAFERAGLPERARAFRLERAERYPELPPVETTP